MMPMPLPTRVAENAPGDFYVEGGICMRCCVVHTEAPELLNDPDNDFKECYFRRQPRTPEEVERAINAIGVSEVAALRYGGTDPDIIAKLRARGCAAECDHSSEGIAARAQTRRHHPAPKPSFWSRLRAKLFKVK